MSNTKAVFRTSMGGYNKQDVNNYIAGLSDSFNAEKRALEAKINELNESLKTQGDISTAADECRTELMQKKTELESAESVISAQNNKLDALKNENDSLRARINSLESELAATNDKLKLLAESEEKLQKYDMMSARVGDLMIEAASSAEKIKAEAKSAAAETLRSYEERERRLRERESELSKSLEDRYSTAVAAINSKLTELAAEGMASLSASLKSAQDEIDSVLERQRAAIRAAVVQTAEKLPEIENFIKPSDLE